MEALKEGLATLNQALSWAKVSANPVLNSQMEEIEIEGITLFFEDGGWGVNRIVVHPGCFYMPNGDPGYPDDFDTECILSPTYEVNSIVGTKEIKRTLWDAVSFTISTVIKNRLDDAHLSSLEL